jgi:Cellulase (glycosyl hydrolase family 5)
LLAIVCATAGFAASTVAAAPRLYVGVLDDEALRWGPGRTAAWGELGSSHASIVRTIVNWSSVAPVRPRDARNPLDRAYRFADVDQFVAAANRRGVEVLVTLWGTPRWANGDRKPNVPPIRSSDFEAFAQALATRYSGAYPTLGFVQFVSIWNEPNTRRFLNTPDRAAAYAALVRAGYRGVKAGSPGTLVAAGETAASHSPATFVSDVARVDPNLPFDAWAHHPYPGAANGGPDDPVPWPNVGLTSLGRFDDLVSSEFGRARTPLWVTEYAESRPEVSSTRIADDLSRAVELAGRVPAVTMFIWFMLKNHQGEPWQSGLVGSAAFGSFTSAAEALDPRNGRVAWPTDGQPHVVRVSARELYMRSEPFETVAVTYTLTGCRSSVTRTGDTARMPRNGWVRVLVEPGDVDPTSLVIVLRNAAGRQVERRFDLVTGTTSACV